MARYMGRGQIAVCQRSGQKMRRADMVEDDQVKGLLVHKDWYEPYHPQLLPPPMRADGIPHFRPAPDDRAAPPAPVLTHNSSSGGKAYLTWTQTSNNIGFTDYYVVSSVLNGAYTQLATIYTPDTYTVTASGNLILNPMTFPQAVTAAVGTVLVVQAHSQEGGLSAYSNQVTA